MLSSLSLPPSTALDKEEFRKVKTILQVLLEHNDAYDFKNPVDWKGTPTLIKA